LAYLTGRDYLGDLDVDARILLKWILKTKVLSCGLDLSGSGYCPVASSREYGNETSGSIRGGKFLTS
jgi:hypothetical protein